jgi:3-hydroxyacyl-CoA dehydrogenase
VREVLCEMDRRGQKTGAGYYDYDEAAQRQAQRRSREKIVREFMAKAGKTARPITDDRRSSSAACTR